MENCQQRPLEWFENRIGEFIYRAPVFKDEIERGQPVSIKISTKDHAKNLFELQRKNRPYVDSKEKLSIA
jgi:hypothetical protein